MTPIQITGSIVAFAMLVGGIASFRLLRLLRLRHIQTWRDLGEPIILLNTTLQNQRSLSAFVWTAQHKDLGDPRVRRQVLLIRTSAIVTVVLLIIAVALFLYGAPGFGES